VVASEGRITLSQSTTSPRIPVIAHAAVEWFDGGDAAPAHSEILGLRRPTSRARRWEPPTGPPISGVAVRRSRGRVRNGVHGHEPRTSTRIERQRCTHGLTVDPAPPHQASLIAWAS
jgi:hypothetical protein